MSDCLFCKIVSWEIPSYKVYENDHVLAFLDIFPINQYHTLVIPKKHSINTFDCEENELIEIMKALKHITKLYKEKLGIENIQIHNNNWKIAQQEVAHTHYHIIPRFEGDEQNVWRTHQQKSHETLKKEHEKLLKKIA